MTVNHPKSQVLDKQRNAGAKPMDHAGKGISVFQFLSAKSFGKQCLDTWDARGAASEKDEINLSR